MNAIDTNIWVYSHDTRDPHKQAVAQQLIATTRPLALPWQVSCEFIAASRKLATVGFTEAQAWSALAAMQTLADFEVSYQYDYIPSSKKQHKSGTIIYSDLEDASDWQTLQTVVRNTRESKRVDMLIYLIANIKIERENVDGDEVQNKDITDDEAVEDEGPRVRSYLYLR